MEYVRDPGPLDASETKYYRHEAEEYEREGHYQAAARSFWMIRDWSRAADMYMRIENWKDAAHCLRKAERFSELKDVVLKILPEHRYGGSVDAHNFNFKATIINIRDTGGLSDLVKHAAQIGGHGADYQLVNLLDEIGEKKFAAKLAFLCSEKDKVPIYLEKIGHIDPSLLAELVQEYREKGKLQDLAGKFKDLGFYEEAGKIYVEASLIAKAVTCLKRLGQPEGSLIQALMQKAREKGKLEELAGALQESGFFEEAAKIYDDLGQAPAKSKSESTQSPKESKPTSQEAASTKSVCPSCNAEVKENWLECPECGVSLKEKVCRNCGEPLEPHWERCPGCRATITHFD